MAPFVALPYGAQAELIYFLGGEVVSNRLWFFHDFFTIDQDAVDGLASGLLSFWTGQVMPLLSQDLELVRVDIHDWTADPSPFRSVIDTSVSGGVSSPSHSANVSVVVPFRWPLQYSREKRNKHYVPGIPISSVTGNDVGFALQDGLFEAYAALIDAARLFLPVLTWRWVVASAWDNGTLRSEQLFGECIGPPRPLENRKTTHYKLGQRRRRLPMPV